MKYCLLKTFRWWSLLQKKSMIDNNSIIYRSSSGSFLYIAMAPSSVAPPSELIASCNIPGQVIDWELSSVLAECVQEKIKFGWTKNDNSLLESLVKGEMMLLYSIAGDERYRHKISWAKITKRFNETTGQNRTKRQLYYRRSKLNLL